MLELGCGNGLLLKYLCEHRGLALQPFGIDRNERAIATARRYVFPDRAASFEVGDIRTATVRWPPFRTVITNPLYADAGYYEQVGDRIQRLHGGGVIADYVRRCQSLLAPGGALVLFCYRGQLEEIERYRDRFARELSAFEHTEVVMPSGGVTFFVGGE